MSANNMVNPAVNPDTEDEIFAKEVEQVKNWWKDSRWRHTKRPFTAEQIVAKRGNLKVEYPSNAQSKKLWNILEGRFQVSSKTINDGYLYEACRMELCFRKLYWHCFCRPAPSELS